MYNPSTTFTSALPFREGRRLRRGGFYRFGGIVAPIMCHVDGYGVTGLPIVHLGGAGFPIIGSGRTGGLPGG